MLSKFTFFNGKRVNGQQNKALNLFKCIFEIGSSIESISPYGLRQDLSSEADLDYRSPWHADNAAKNGSP
jgi:hypothetical protein